MTPLDFYLRCFIYPQIHKWESVNCLQITLPSRAGKIHRHTHTHTHTHTYGLTHIYIWLNYWICSEVKKGAVKQSQQQVSRIISRTLVGFVFKPAPIRRIPLLWILDEWWRTRSGLTDRPDRKEELLGPSMFAIRVVPAVEFRRCVLSCVWT